MSTRRRVGRQSRPRTVEPRREIRISLTEAALQQLDRLCEARALTRSEFIELQLFQSEQRARADAEAANRAKDDFLALLSHELRTPLNPIIGFAQLLRRGRTSEEQTQRALEVIERNGRLQAALIDDMLDVTRIMRGSMQICRQPLDLSAVVLAALETVREKADEKGLHLEVSFPAGPVEVVGDAVRLQQVIWNLLTNALKFTPTGGKVCLQLNCEAGTAILSIRDTGIGIGRNFLPHVFDLFRQEHDTPDRRQGGLGLGLSISRHIIDLHSGRLDIESEGQGFGATVTLSLPCDSV